MLGQGCHPSRPPAALCSPCPPPFLLSSAPCPPTGQQQQRNQGQTQHSIPPGGLQSLSKRLFWVYCDLRESRECLQHLLHPICRGCWCWVARAVGSPLGEAAEGLCHWEGMWGAQSKHCDFQGDAGSKSAFKKTSRWWQENSFNSFCNSVVKRYEQSKKIWWFKLQL